jgi:hypothetical protein
MNRKILLILFIVFWTVPISEILSTVSVIDRFLSDGKQADTYSGQVFAQVDTEWVKRYNGPANNSDWANAMALDDSGNVYVTGYSFGSGSSADYATIKYRPNGDTAWLRRCNGLGNDWDQANAIAVDESSNVYVTGYSYTSSYNSDYTTVKYSSTGNELWIRSYNGLGNSYDYAYAIAVDALGNAYVTGASTGSGTNLDYATVKYRPNGDTAWVKRYNGPGNSYDNAYAIAGDDSGNVYVTGASVGIGTNYDCVTIKYDSSGNQLWVRSYSGPGEDKGGAIVLDRAGYIYVTGHSASPGTYFDYVTLKYYPNGDTAWVRTYDGLANAWDEASAIAVDSSGNVYVTGFSDGSGTYRDYATIKYYANGDTAWVRRYNGPGNSTDEASAIAVDVFGNVYVTGFSSGDGTYSDYATIKYSAKGYELWVHRYNGPGNSSDEASGIAIDDSNNVYVTGASWGGGTATDYATIKYMQLQFLRGDVTGNGVINLGDIVYLIGYLYRGGPPPVPLQKGDVNCDREVNLGDLVYLINYLFKGGPAPDC